MATHPVSKEMHERGVKLCKQFMGRSWANITSDQLRVDRIKGGLSNEMYKCTLSEKVRTYQ